MARVGGKDTSPEVLTRKYLFHAGFRFRKNVKYLPGKPDIVIPKYKVAIFVHGCFWHQHEGCPKSRRPQARKGFWSKKLDANIARDRRNTELLEAMGWRIAVVWECAVKKKDFFNRTMEALVSWIRSEGSKITIP